MNKDKSIKDLQKYNDKLKNQVMLLEIRNYTLQHKIDKVIKYINNMKPLSLVETSIKEELKNAYNPKESSIRGTDEYFDTVCHLEDFEIAIWNIKDMLKGEDKE